MSYRSLVGGMFAHLLIVSCVCSALIEWRVLRDNGSAISAFDVQYRFVMYKPATATTETRKIISDWQDGGTGLDPATLSMIPEQVWTHIFVMMFISARRAYRLLFSPEYITMSVRVYPVRVPPYSNELCYMHNSSIMYMSECSFVQVESIPRCWPAESVSRWAVIVPALPPKERVSFRVRAWNGIGVSGWSKPSERIMPNGTAFALLVHTLS